MDCCAVLLSRRLDVTYRRDFSNDMAIFQYDVHNPTLFSNIFTAHTAAHLQPPPSAPASTSSTMVIKTEVCAFSDTRIYPGHGMRFVRRDGQVMAQLFCTSKLLSIVFDPGGVPHRTGLRVGFWWAVTWGRVP